MTAILLVAQLSAPAPKELHLRLHADPLATARKGTEQPPKAPDPQRGKPVEPAHLHPTPWWTGYELPSGPGRAWPNATYGGLYER